MSRIVQSTIELVVHVTVSHPEGTPAPEGISGDASVEAGYSVEETTIVESSVVTEGISLG